MSDVRKHRSLPDFWGKITCVSIGRKAVQKHFLQVWSIPAAAFHPPIHRPVLLQKRKGQLYERSSRSLSDMLWRTLRQREVSSFFKWRKKRFPNFFYAFRKKALFRLSQERAVLRGNSSRLVKCSHLPGRCFACQKLLRSGVWNTEVPVCVMGKVDQYWEKNNFIYILKTSTESLKFLCHRMIASG